VAVGGAPSGSALGAFGFAAREATGASSARTTISGDERRIADTGDIEGGSGGQWETNADRGARASEPDRGREDGRLRTGGADATTERPESRTNAAELLLSFLLRR